MFCRTILRDAFLAEDVLGDGGEFFANGTAYELLLDISCSTFTGTLGAWSGTGRTLAGGRLVT
jgi:hypothetical protein